jgi:hypothetical protein
MSNLHFKLTFITMGAERNTAFLITFVTIVSHVISKFQTPLI